MMKIGLRVDVDTYRGTKQGVPELCRIFKKYDIEASFFFSVGPDNMGRHLWRLLNPTFLWKMLRSNAVGLYGSEIILMGTMWPGPQIGKRLGHIIKATAENGHEIGLHAWDHHREQSKIEQLSIAEIKDIIERGIETLINITGNPPTASAVPGWRCNDKVLQVKESFGFKYNSDCRGYSIFYPQVADQVLKTVQVPVTLPTYDEVIGSNGINNENYNDYMLSLLQPEQLKVLTIHAEAEGGKCSAMFENFVQNATAKGYEFVPLGNIVDTAKQFKSETIVPKNFPGREGWLACQEKFNPQNSQP
ncbi:MAG: 4-deoxy-4-formamido-L-arabinose-phosphoundecaprenol deformylase [Victivallaceae bacterium]|nr:4-deoxy-4-formamido-L-arabinose-phosphoundecaprenol deformylase [Victivallaceae bacterium]